MPNNGLLTLASKPKLAMWQTHRRTWNWGCLIGPVSPELRRASCWVHIKTLLGFIMNLQIRIHTSSSRSDVLIFNWCSQVSTPRDQFVPSDTEAKCAFPAWLSILPFIITVIYNLAFQGHMQIPNSLCERYLQNFKTQRTNWKQKTDGISMFFAMSLFAFMFWF